jgi:hypothetical protein
VITPAAAARRRDYDPWRTFQANVGKYRTVEQPYLALLELGRKVSTLEADGVQTSKFTGRTREGPIADPPTEADKHIASWCARYGSLGLVPVLVRKIDLPERVEQGDPSTARRIKSVQYFRDGGEWKNEESCREFGSATSAEVERLVLKSALKETRAEWLSWSSHAYHERDHDYLRDFFPHSWAEGASFAPPKPSTSAFWDSYGEPVWEFRKPCGAFVSAVDAIGHGKGRGSKDQRARAFAFLRVLAETVAPSFRRNDRTGEVTEERVSPGLLASYALMFLMDLEVGRRCRRCGACGRYFVSNEHRARYCSPTCRNTAQSRRYRARK